MPASPGIGREKLDVTGLWNADVGYGPGDVTPACAATDYKTRFDPACCFKGEIRRFT